MEDYEEQPENVSYSVRVGGEQDGCCNHLYSQVQGYHSEKRIEAKTPATPRRRESTPTYNEMFLSGRSSRERTPGGLRNVTKKKPFTKFESQLPRTDRSSGQETPGDNEYHSHSNDRRQITERRCEERSSRKCASPSGGKKIYSSEDEIYRKGLQATAYQGTDSDIVVASRGPSILRAASAPHDKNGLPTPEELKRQGKHSKIYCETSMEEDSACFAFRGRWNNACVGMNSALISTSQVSVVERFVQAQDKALGQHNDRKGMHEEEISRNYKPVKIKNLNQQKAVAAVLAFQRWRHTQLKKLFSMELKNVLEETKKDEASLATLERELVAKDKHLSQLRSELSHYKNASRQQMHQRHMHELLDANVQELERECHKALERASLAEDMVRKRDAEVLRLRERLRNLDEKGVRIDSELQATMTLMQKEKETALDEGQVLLAQLALRDEDVTNKLKEIKKLQKTITRLADQQTSQQKEVQCMNVGNQAQMELTSCTERCYRLGQERQKLLVQLHHAAERAVLASRRAEELQMELHFTTKERVKVSEDLAGEMVEQLNRLTRHMKELETSVDRTPLCLRTGVSRKMTGLFKSPPNLAKAVGSLNLITSVENHGDIGWSGLCQEHEDSSSRQVCFPFDRQSRRAPHMSDSVMTPFRTGERANISSIDQEGTLTKFKNWTAWKWRWAASAAKADRLSKQLRNQGTIPKPNLLEESEINTVERGGVFRDRAVNQVKKLAPSRYDNLSPPDEEKMDPIIPRHKLVALIMSAWRAFTRMSSLERKATCRNETLNKIISALPWWIRRVGERRLLERYFFHWQLLALRANRDKLQMNPKSNIVPRVDNALTSRARNQQGDQPQIQARPTTPARTAVRDAEVQTARVAIREAELEGRQKTPLRFASVPRSPLQGKSKPHIRDDKCRRLPGGSKLRSMTGKKDILLCASSPLTATAFCALQSTLQQELTELQHILSQEMKNMQQIAARSGDHLPALEMTRQTLTTAFGVCNNLAQALMVVRSQLSNTGDNVKGRAGSSPPGTSSAAPQSGHGETGDLRSRHSEEWDGETAGSIPRETTSGRPFSSGSRLTRTPRCAPTIRQERGGCDDSFDWQPENRPGLRASTSRLRKRETKCSSSLRIR